MRGDFLRLKFLPYILLLFVIPRVNAQVPDPEWDQQQLKRVSLQMQDYVKAGGIAGAVTLVIRDNFEHISVTGLSDIASQRPMTRDTIFRVASMTKLVTATALMQLVVAGKVQLDDPVSKYIPAFRGALLKDSTPAGDILIRSILTHTAGLANVSGLSGERTLEQEVDAIARQPLQFPQGATWQYSSGLTVAGRLIEVVSGQRFEDYLQTRIFEPLKMSDTTFRLTKEQVLRLATTYKPGKAPGELVPVEIPDPTASRMPNPSGGLYSTADDMAKFYRAILRAQRGEETELPQLQTITEQMLTPQTGELVTGFTPGNAWGLGWCLIQKPQGVTRLFSPGSFGHGGAWGTQGWVDVRRGIVLLLMIQRTEFGNSDGSDVRDSLNELVLTAWRGTNTANARFTNYLGYSGAVELTMGTTRAVLCPEAGGRVLEYSVAGQNMMFLDEREKVWQPGQASIASAGRFDFGPELMVPRHPALWSGAWTAEITGPASVRLVSVQDAASGLQLMRDFELTEPSSEAGKADITEAGEQIGAFTGAALSCRQTMMNISDRTVEYCHWGRSFSPSGGICLIPLGEHPGRFPSRYAMYEEGAVINVRNADEKIRERDGFLEILGPPRKPKLGFDSYAGWLGYLMPGNRLFVKRFPTWPDRVYNEAAGLTLSVWYPQSGGMIELEPIGPRERLAPGQVASFTEEWSIAEFPFPEGDALINLKALRALVEQPHQSNTR